MIKIDGSFGEGGGQILRTCLSLSLLKQKPFEITNIRANRDKPGLKPQHIKCIQAATQIAKAEVSNFKLGAQELSFTPHDLIPGEYRFDINTAGSTSLVSQMVCLPLALAKEKSRVVITGGTHVLWSPTHHYLAYQWLPYMRKIGINMKLKFVKAGFYPKGEGKIIIELSPSESLSPIEVLNKGNLQRIKGLSAVANLDLKVAERQKTQINNRLKKIGVKYYVKVEEMRSRWKNSMVLFFAEYENGSGCFVSLGALGKRAEKVADEAVDQLMEYTSSSGCVDQYLADQLILPLCFTNQKSKFSTTKVTQHLLTIVDVVKKFLDIEIKVDGKLDEVGVVEIN